MLRRCSRTQIPRISTEKFLVGPVCCTSLIASTKHSESIQCPSQIHWVMETCGYIIWSISFFSFSQEETNIVELYKKIVLHRYGRIFFPIVQKVFPTGFFKNYFDNYTSKVAKLSDRFLRMPVLYMNFIKNVTTRKCWGFHCIFFYYVFHFSFHFKLMTCII